MPVTLPGVLAAAKPYPLRVPGCVLWFDFADTSTITVGTGASSVSNKSGGVVTASLDQATVGAQPATGTRTQNGRNVLDFDGVDDTMLGSASPAVSQPFTLFVVCKNDDGADSTKQVAVTGNGSAIALQKSTTNFWAIDDGTQVVSATASDTAAHYYTKIGNNAATGSLLRRDGTTIIAAQGGSGTNGWTSTGFRVGRVNTSGANWWDGWIGEILLYNTALSATNYGLIEAYLAAKWAI